MIIHVFVLYCSIREKLLTLRDGGRAGGAVGVGRGYGVGGGGLKNTRLFNWKLSRFWLTANVIFTQPWSPTWKLSEPGWIETGRCAFNRCRYLLPRDR